MRKKPRISKQLVVIKKTSMVDEIVSILRKEIITQDALVGSLLSEKKLSLRFGASNHTIRSALKILAREGLITISQGRATRVNDYRLQVGLDVFPDLLNTCSEIITPDVFTVYSQYLLWFYNKIIIMATRRAKPSHKKNLMKIVSLFTDEMTREEYWESHILFFRELLKIGDNVLLMMFHNSHVKILRRLLGLGIMKNLTLPGSYHRETSEQLVEAICRGDEKHVLKVMQNYRDSTEKSIKKVFNEAHVFL